MRITIDHDKCTGHGRCYDLAPSIFDADDSGYAVLLVEGDVPADLEGIARQASLNCPEGAISFS